MIGEEVRQHRGIKQISFAAIALLLSLTVVALYQRSQAEAQRTIGRPAPPNPAMNSRRRIFDPSRWISEPYHNYGCRERWFALVPMFAALRKSASGPPRERSTALQQTDVRPRVHADDVASGAHHARAEGRHGCVIGP